MTDLPIIFSAPMVLALLAGRKTQTRRLAWRDGKPREAAPLKPLAPFQVPSAWQKVQPGNRLWVRECVVAEERFEEDRKGVRYRADDQWLDIPDGDDASAAWFLLSVYRSDDDLGGCRPVPSIHMPRWASRLTLIVEAVKFERLQDITEEDAGREGIAPSKTEPHLWRAYEGATGATRRAAFAMLWDHLHGPESWDANPEVVALTFRVIQQNIDRMKEAA